MKRIRFPLLLLFALATSMAWYWFRPVAAQGSVRLTQQQAENLASAHPTNAVTITYEERLMKAGSSNVIVSQRGTRAWRADGSSVDLQNFHSMDNRYLYSVRDIRLTPNVEASVRDDIRLFSARGVTVLSPEKNAGRLNPDVSCVSNFFGDVGYEKSGADESFLGYPAVRLVPKGKRGDISHEILMVPSLGCLQVRRMTSFKSKEGSVSDTSEWIAIRIDLGEPAKELFSIPAIYRHVVPSEAIYAEWKRLGVTIPDSEMHAVRSNDGMYEGKLPDLSRLIEK